MVATTMTVISLLLLLATPAVYILHWFLSGLDWLHRRACDKHRRKWRHATLPHLRAQKQDAAHSLTHWRLHCDEGRQVWKYEPESTRKQTFIERYMLDQVPASAQAPRSTADQSLFDGAKFLVKLQHEDGHWPNDYSGPMFLTPGLVFAKYACFGGDRSKMFTSPQQCAEIVRYLVNRQNADGGWGMHTESHSTMFGTTLNYVTLRLCGEPAAAPYCTAARDWIQSRGGASSIPAWGKMWLAVMNLYHYDGVDAILPELWLLPRWCFMSMGNFWCHSRIVTLPFGYLYGKRWACPLDPLLQEIRSELYTVNYNAVKWSAQRHNVFPADVYTPHSFLYDVASWVLLAYDRWHSRRLRERSIRLSYEHIKYDDLSTNFICLGPVNKVLNMLITAIEEGTNSEHFAAHAGRVDDYLWMGSDGMRMSGYNGSQLWDTSFAVQAICAGNLQSECPNAMRLAHHYIDVAQVQEDPPNAEAYFRHRTKGAWNFSTRSQGWQVSDCTAEGLRVVLLLRNGGLVKEPFPLTRIYDGVDEILSLRHEGEGGWASYEPPRGPKYLELFNCAEIYKDIMIDYTYAECSSSCVHTLCLFRAQFPHYRANEVNLAIREGVRCVKAKQRADGSFYGSWGVCFTYAGWLVSEALVLADEPPTSTVLRKLSQFTLSKQREDGGWGEDFNSCVTCEYVHSPDGSQVVNTAWAVMTLIACNLNTTDGAIIEKIEAGVRFMMGRQLTTGDWAQERIMGVFNGNCAIHYPGYKNSMPVWAIGKYVTWRRQRKEKPI